MVKDFLVQAVKSIEAERDRQVAVVKDRIVREKIAPYNANVDQLRASALAEIENELNGKILELRQTYEARKQDLVRMGEEDKKKNAESVLATELALVTVDYDAHIAKLNAQIAEIKD